MKTNFLKVLASALLLFSSATLLPQTGYAQNVPGPVINQPAHPDKPAAAPSTPAPAPAQPATKPATAQFDGAAMYKAAFDAIVEMQIRLDSPEAIAKFTKEWEHKFDATGELKTEEGADKAVRKMMESFGQRFDYSFDKEATKAEENQVNATHIGIGATLKLTKLAEIVKGLPKDSKKEDVLKAIAISQENAVQIEEPMENSPALKAGLQPGDIIRKADGKDFNGLQLKEAIGLIKGDANTTVKLTIERTDAAGKTDTLEISVTRASFTVPVTKFKDLGDGISYVKLNDFMSKFAVQEMHDHFKKAAAGKGLIIDLRGNPGGSLPAVLTMVGMLLEDGPIMVTRSRNGDRIIDSETTINKNFVLNTQPSDADPNKIEVSVSRRPKLMIPNDMPIIVLIDEGSASASEILSGSLQHNRRAIVVGMPSHGKGVGQSVVKLPFGRSLHITSFEFIPGRTPNDWTGVIPNVKVERGEDPKVDLQLDKAKELMLPMIKSVEEMKSTRDAQNKKHHEDFDKELIERNKE